MKIKDPNKLEHFHVIGVSYQSADVAVREQFSITVDREEAFYEALRGVGVTDVMVISTCNRTEIYFFSENIHPLVNVWLSFTSGDTDTLMNAHFHHRGEAALNHLLRVSCGLESQIPGDFEIIMQVRRAFRQAKSLKMANGLFERMLNTAIHSSKQVKNQTSFSTGASSVSYATVRYLRDYFSVHSSPKILLVGLGEIGRVALENILKHFPQESLTISNRSEEKLADFAHTYGVASLPFSELSSSLENYDAIVLATGAPEPIIKLEHITPEFNGVIIDLGVPSNTEHAVGEIANLVNVDALSEITKATLEARLEMVPIVESLVAENIQDFLIWYRKRELLPIINEMTQQLRESLSSELNVNPLVDYNEQEMFINRMTKRYEAELFRRIEDGVRQGKMESLMSIPS